MTRVAIFGAGASAIAAAYYLREAGITDIAIFEKADTPGGTWRDNRYPGVACDVPSHLYRYSFAPNPDWTQRCSPGAEIQQYMLDTARSLGVDRLIHTGHEVTEARYDAGQWHVVTSQGDQGRFDAVISATGALHHPRFPDIEGMDSFGGNITHSARWIRPPI